MSVELPVIAVSVDPHLKASRALIRLLDKERSALTVLETYVQEFRDFRTMQAATRVNFAEGNARRATEAVEAGIAAWRESLSAP